MKIKISSIALLLLIVVVGCTNVTNRSNGAVSELTILKKLNIGSCKDAVVTDNLLFVIGSEKIYSYDISLPENPELLDTLPGLGNVRQIQVQEGYAYVTSREEGLFVIDISNPKKLRKVAHYDTLELATGIDASGSIAAVTNRQYGVEFLNVSNPSKPSFLSMIRTGEAQSVFLTDTIAVIGDWGTKEVVLTNISNPQNPQIISRIELDGYGDGVFVKGDLCFAATGHHARGWKNSSTDSTYWGKGHGMEIIDISEPGSPKKLSVLKFPVKYYMLYADMWDIQVVGNYAFVGDSEAGLFVVDIKDPTNPFIVSHAAIPIPPMPDYMHSFFKGKNKSGPIGGFAVGDGVVYIAGLMNDLYVVEAPETAMPVTLNRRKISYSEPLTNKPENFSSYDAKGQVHSACVLKNEKKALIAAGDGGVHEVSLFPQIEGKQILETGTIVFDVFLENEILYLAEGIDGLSVWNYDGSTEPRFISRYSSKNGGIYQLLINTEQGLAILHAGADHLEILDVENLNEITLLTSFKPNSGLLYRLPIANGFLNNRFVAGSWHTTGCFFYDIKSQDGIKFLGQFIPPLGVINGVAFLDDKVLAIYEGGYIIQNGPDKPQLKIKNPIKTGQLYLKGKPVVYDNSRLYVSNRMKGIVFAVDISNINSPKENWQLQLSGNPGLIKECGDMVIVPGGHDGLLVFNKFSGEPYFGKK